MAIILARRGKPVMKLERTIIQEENYLQRYLDEHPDILPLDQLQADIRPLVLVREFSNNEWADRCHRRGSECQYLFDRNEAVQESR